MILSVSRRTDIPALYGEWFFHRLKEGYVCVRNPFNKSMVSKIDLQPNMIDCIVFWTKDATPFLKHLPTIDKLGYKYYFQFTITPYDQTIECGIRNKEKIISTFQELSKKIGKDKVIWRYDPILLTEKIDVQWHIQQFQRLCEQLARYTNEVIISFLDEYTKLDKSKFRAPIEEEMKEIGEEFAMIAKGYHISIKTCAEEIVFRNGIEKASCIDGDLIEKICGYSLNVKKDKYQRSACGCIESIDIGEYDTCTHNCAYCYANNNKKTITTKNQKHHQYSPLLIGDILPSDKIYERKINSLRKK